MLELPVQVRSLRGVRSVVEALLVLAILLFFLWFLVAGIEWDLHPLVDWVPDRLIWGAGALWMSGALAENVYRLVGGYEGVLIDEDGIDDRSRMLSLGRVHWDEIRSAGPFWRSFVKLDLSRAYFDRSSFWKRAHLWIRRHVFRLPIGFSCGMLESGRVEVLWALQSGLEESLAAQPQAEGLSPAE